MITVRSGTVIAILFVLMFLFIFVAMNFFDRGSQGGRVLGVLALLCMMGAFVVDFLYAKPAMPDPDPAAAPAPPPPSLTAADVDQLLEFSVGVSDHTRQHVRRLIPAILKDVPLTPESVDQVFALVPEITPETRGLVRNLLEGHLQEAAR